MILLLLSVSIPPVTRNFIILCVVDGTTCIFRNPGLPMIPLYGDVDLTIMKSIHVDVKGPSAPSSSPKDGNEILRLGEKLWDIFCLTIFCHDWIIIIA
ncbi:hypothetical protein Tco_0477245 [Tanacetum coccineum]